MLIITIVALLMASTMGLVALRLLRDQQRRSEARVAALSMALESSQPASGHLESASGDLDRAGPESLGAIPPVPSRETAALATIEPRQDTEQSQAPQAPQVPVAPAAARAMPQVVDLDEASLDSDFTWGAGDQRDEDEFELIGQPTAVPHRVPVHHEVPMRGMFGQGDLAAPDVAYQDGVPTATRDDRRWLIAAGLVLVGLLGAMAIWQASRGGEPSVAATTAAVAAGGVPVELVSLGHEQSKTDLTIRGLVRNPNAGSIRAGTSASVFLFDGEGSFLGSGRSVLDTPTLSPGAEASFEVTLPANSRVRRYRVTFRGADGSVVPHLDKR